MQNAYAIIMAGGNGERFWPLSTPDRPKQFVSLFGDKALVRHAADRLRGVIPPERTLVVTARRFVRITRKTLPDIPKENIIGEPCRRDTAAAVAVACGLVKRLGGDNAVGCILTADQLMTPVDKFQQALRDAIKVAGQTDAIVTMGITPDYPATGFGYIEVGERVGLKMSCPVCRVARFVEKPSLGKARRYLAAGRFLWNSGMFFWRAGVLERAFAAAAPDIGRVIAAVASAKSVSHALAAGYPSLRATSFDYAVMEHIANILVVKSSFTWDDVGSWLAIRNHFPADAGGNTTLGETALLDVKDSIVVSDHAHVTAVIGMKDVVVVHTPRATLVCPVSRVQDVKTLLKGRTRE